MEHGDGNKPRILIVDDEAPVREALWRWFTIRGFVADVAADGVEAVEKCSENEYDVVTMDLEMPRMTGAEAIAIIHNKRPNLPIIVLTGYARDFQDDLSGSVVKVLTKPLSLRKVEEEVREVIGRPERARERERD